MNKSRLIRITILLTFFLSTLWLVLGMPVIFNSPDENANYQFVAASGAGTLLIEPLNFDLGDIFHPRSVVSIDGVYAPRSFLGMSATYGVLSVLLNVFGALNLILALTPALAVLALLAWRSIVFKMFENDRLADISALLLLLHPAWWYYSARTMMHNVPFVSLLIFGAWFFVQKSGRRWLSLLLGGLMIGLAIAFRASEVIWIGALLVALTIWMIRSKKWSWREPALVIVGLGVALIPFAVMNNVTYGGPLTTGYTIDGISQAVSSYEGSGSESLPSIANVLFPFGIHELAILRHVWGYGFWLYPWMSGLAIIGIILAALGHAESKQTTGRFRTWTIGTLVLAAWLAVVYGSWSFHDNPDPNAVTIANSYVRYWLPLFVLASPLAARGMIWLTKPVHKAFGERVCHVTYAVLIMTCVIFSGIRVFGGEDGLIATREHLWSFQEKREVILSSTEENAILIVDRADKFVWPDRTVITPLRSETTYDSMPVMTYLGPLYYFGITLPEKDMTYLNEDKLAAMALFIEEVATVEDETLYRIAQVASSQ